MAQEGVDTIRHDPTRLRASLFPHPSVSTGGCNLGTAGRIIVKPSPTWEPVRRSMSPLRERRTANKLAQDMTDFLLRRPGTSWASLSGIRTSGEGEGAQEPRGCSHHRTLVLTHASGLGPPNTRRGWGQGQKQQPLTTESGGGDSSPATGTHTCRHARTHARSQRGAKRLQSCTTRPCAARYPPTPRPGSVASPTSRGEDG